MAYKSNCRPICKHGRRKCYLIEAGKIEDMVKPRLDTDADPESFVGKGVQIFFALVLIFYRGERESVCHMLFIFIQLCFIVGSNAHKELMLYCFYVLPTPHKLILSYLYI